MKRLLLCVGAILLLWVNGLCAETSDKCPGKPEFKAKLKPSLINGEEDNYGGALDMELSVHYSLWCGTETQYKKKLFSEVELNGILVTDTDLNQRPIRTEVRIAGSINLSRPKIVGRGDREGEIVVTQKGFYLGRINGGLNIGHETDQEFNNQNYTVGAELTYVFTKHEGWKALIPSFSAAYEEVDSYESDILENIGVEDDHYERFRIEGSWKFLLGDYLPESFEPLTLHVDARYYKDFGRSDAFEATDLDESKYGAVSLDYTFEEPYFYEMLSGVYLKVSDGRIPPIEENSTQVYAGIILWGR